MHFQKLHITSYSNSHLPKTAYYTAYMYPLLRLKYNKEVQVMKMIKLAMMKLKAIQWREDPWLIV